MKRQRLTRLPRSIRNLRRTTLVLLLACLPAAGCGAHVPFQHRGAPVPHARSLHAARSVAPAHGVPAAEDPSGPAGLYRLARLHVEVDSLALAESELREALSRGPEYAPAMALLSKVYFQLGRNAEAVALLQPVLARPEAFAPRARRALLAGLALHEDALGNRDLAREAIAAAQLAGDDEAESADVYLKLRGDAPDSADAMAAGALAHDGKSAVNLNNFGITRLRAGDLDAARQAFTTAIERDPALPGPYYNLAILEKFYRFDGTAGARWFGEYWTRSQADPDGLRSAFPVELANVPVPGGNRP